MVGVAQLVELRIVIPAVEGSIPFVHPIFLPDHSTHMASDSESGQAKVAELVDALDLGSSGATCESSSLSFRTILVYSSSLLLFISLLLFPLFNFFACYLERKEILFCAFVNKGLFFDLRVRDASFSRSDLQYRTSNDD